MANSEARRTMRPTGGAPCVADVSRESRSAPFRASVGCVKYSGWTDSGLRLQTLRGPRSRGVFTAALKRAVDEKRLPERARSAVEGRALLRQATDLDATDDGYLRNIPTERVAESVMFPCSFLSSGCTALFAYRDKPIHEMTCAHRPYSCPMSDLNECSWTGDVAQLKGHVREVHGNMGIISGARVEVMASFNVCERQPHYWMTLQDYEETDFLVVLRRTVKGNRALFRALILALETEVHAKKFLCRVEVTSGNRRLFWQDHPYDARSGLKTVLEGPAGLTFDDRVGRLFAGPEGTIRVAVDTAIA